MDETEPAEMLTTALGFADWAEFAHGVGRQAVGHYVHSVEKGLGLAGLRVDRTQNRTPLRSSAGSLGPALVHFGSTSATPPWAVDIMDFPTPRGRGIREVKWPPSTVPAKLHPYHSGAILAAACISFYFGHT